MSRKPSFVDRVKVFIKAGDGGDGHVGFYRGRFQPKGGPDGGDGGRGGDIILRASFHKSTLLEFRKKRHFKAKNGERGGRQQCTGASASSLIIDVPIGTQALDAESLAPLGEVLHADEEYILQEGGRGGLGNVHFKSSVNQAPQKATPGKKTIGRWIYLDLKILADVGMVGKPNAGKSTLLTALTRASSKIADYPFTTLHPKLGVVEGCDTPFTLADMPGLIENASLGAGLGIEFLKHIERTKVLLYVVSLESQDAQSIWNDFAAVQNEIVQYRQDLLHRPFLIVLNKADLADAACSKKALSKFKSAGYAHLTISAKHSTGLEVLKEKLYALVSQ